MSASSPPLASLKVPGRDQGEVMRGLGFVVFAMIVLPGQDAVAKILSSNLSPGEISLARFLFQTAVTAPFLLYWHGLTGFRPRLPWQNAVRGGLIAASSTLFFAAVKLMPLADALAIFFIEPFLLIVLAGIFEKERIGWGLWVAVATGFLGVLLVVQPSYEVFGIVSLLPALAGFLFAIYTILSRRVSAVEKPLTMQFSAGISAAVFLAIAVALGTFAGWEDFALRPIDANAFALLLLMGLFGTSGHFAFVLGSRLAPTALIAPLQYVEIAAAVAVGYLVFGDFPSFLNWIGIAVIVASGVFVLLREAGAKSQSAAISA